MVFNSTEILGILTAHPYTALLPLAIVEGPLVTIACGVLVANKQLAFWPAFTIVVTGDLVGDSALYALGRWGGTRAVATCASHATIKRIAAFRDQFLRKADRVLITGKFTQAVGAPVLIAAGLARVAYGRFLTINFFTTIIKSFVLLCVGYAFHAGYTAIGQNMASLSAMLLIAGLITLYFLLCR